MRLPTWHPDVGKAAETTAPEPTGHTGGKRSAGLALAPDFVCGITYEHQWIRNLEWRAWLARRNENESEPREDQDNTQNEAKDFTDSPEGHKPGMARRVIATRWRLWASCWFGRHAPKAGTVNEFDLRQQVHGTAIFAPVRRGFAVTGI
jgi:hypothetical protein